MLPDIDGLEVLRRLQTAGICVPVLMLTARAEKADRVIGLEVGADDYLTKPFSMRELAAVVSHELRAPITGKTHTIGGGIAGEDSKTHPG